MTDCFAPKVFIRHHRQLRAIQLQHQAWFALPDIARLIGRALDERSIRKFDPDQSRSAWLDCNGRWSKELLISESALFVILVNYYVPENRALRHWLTHEVLPVLRDNPEPHAPSRSTLHWLSRSVGLLEWQSEYWVRLRDVPDVIKAPQERGRWRRWGEACLRFIR